MRPMKTYSNALMASALIVSVLALASAAYLFIKREHTDTRLTELEQRVLDSSTTTAQKISDIEAVLVAMQTESSIINEALKNAVSESATLEEAFERVTSNVETLEKLTTTDEELLQKYSKVFFLNEHYVPEDLHTIPSEYVYNKERTYQIHDQVWPYLEDLLDTAKKDDMNLSIISAFRSFGDQAVLKGAYTVIYGAGTANQFSADQGYSEHQLGTTVDFTTPTVGATFSGFAATPEFAWLEDNAHRFGFILSYPKGNEHYQFEPWHWRFVGTKLARYLHERDKYFYDLSQREINDYIIHLFE